MHTVVGRVSALLFLSVLAVAAPIRTQDPPPRFPSDDSVLAASRGMNLTELPGTGLGLRAGLHVYPLRRRVISVGIGGEAMTAGASQTPPKGIVNLRPT